MWSWDSSSRRPSEGVAYLSIWSCLWEVVWKKIIGRNCLFYDELLTLVTEVEAALNSWLFTYISSKDVEEPLTPLHLIVGYRILTLPGSSIPDDPVYAPESLAHRMRCLSQTLLHFFKWCKNEYLLKLHEDKGSMYIVKDGDVMTCMTRDILRVLWGSGRQSLMCLCWWSSSWCRCQSIIKRRSPKSLHWSLHHIHPLEVCCGKNNENPAGI